MSRTPLTTSAGALMSAFALALTAAVTMPQNAEANGPGMIIPLAIILKNAKLENGLNGYIATQSPQSLQKAFDNGLSPDFAPYAAQCREDINKPAELTADAVTPAMRTAFVDCLQNQLKSTKAETAPAPMSPIPASILRIAGK